MTDDIRFDSRDYRKNRITGAFGYVFFFVPLLVDSKSPFHRYCANQGLLGTIVYAALCVAFWLIDIVLGWIPFIGGLLGLIGSLAKLSVFAVMLYHGYLAWNKKIRPLPFVGEIDLLK